MNEQETRLEELSTGKQPLLGPRHVTLEPSWADAGEGLMACQPGANRALQVKLKSPCGLRAHSRRKPSSTRDFSFSPANCVP